MTTRTSTSWEPRSAGTQEQPPLPFAAPEQGLKQQAHLVAGPPEEGLEVGLVGVRVHGQGQDKHAGADGPVVVLDPPGPDVTAIHLAPHNPCDSIPTGSDGALNHPLEVGCMGPAKATCQSAAFTASSDCPSAGRLSNGWQSVKPQEYMLAGCCHPNSRHGQIVSRATYWLCLAPPSLPAASS